MLAVLVEFQETNHYENIKNTIFRKGSNRPIHSNYAVRIL